MLQSEHLFISEAVIYDFFVSLRYVFFIIYSALYELCNKKIEQLLKPLILILIVKSFQKTIMAALARIMGYPVLYI